MLLYIVCIVGLDGRIIDGLVYDRSKGKYNQGSDRGFDRGGGRAYDKWGYGDFRRKVSDEERWGENYRRPEEFDENDPPYFTDNYGNEMSRRGCHRLQFEILALQLVMNGLLSNVTNTPLDEEELQRDMETLQFDPPQDRPCKVVLTRFDTLRTTLLYMYMKALNYAGTIRGDNGGADSSVPEYSSDGVGRFDRESYDEEPTSLFQISEKQDIDDLPYVYVHDILKVYENFVAETGSTTADLGDFLSKKVLDA